MVCCALSRWEGIAGAVLLAVLLLADPVEGFSQGPEVCRRLCPDARELPYGGCYVAQAVVDPATSMCHRCGAARFNETVDCATDAESVVTDFLAFVDETTLTQNATAAANGPAQLEALQMNVRLGGSGASARVEFRVGDRREMVRTVASGSQVDYAGSVLTGDSLLAQGTLTTGPQPPTAPLKASIFVLVTCVSALSGGASCPVTASLRYRWMPEAATTAAPSAATSVSSGGSKGLSTGAIAGIAAACAIVCMGVAGGLGVLVQTKLSKKEDAAHASGAASRRAQYEAGAGSAAATTAMTGAAGGFPIATPRESHHTSIALHGTDESDAVGGNNAPSVEETDDGAFHDIGAQGRGMQRLE